MVDRGAWRIQDEHISFMPINVLVARYSAVILFGLPMRKSLSLSSSRPFHCLPGWPIALNSYPLKLPRCEFGHDLVNGAGFADQQQRRRHRFGCFLFGRHFYPLRIERDAVWIGHNQIYLAAGLAHRPRHSRGSCSLRYLRQSTQYTVRRAPKAAPFQCQAQFQGAAVAGRLVRGHQGNLLAAD
jgi:hypothetical protein